MSEASAAAIRAAVDATGKYVIREEIKGGMNAYAFRALHRALGIDVFLKIYDTDETDLDSELFREPRFLVEATARGSGSGNLVRVHDAERMGRDRVLVAMEFVEGGSLETALRHHPFGQAEAVDVAVGILHGVAQLHSNDLVHRDLKPGNVLLQNRGGKPVPKVGDFGSVARLPDANGAVTASRHTMLYVPPEGWEVPSTFNRRSDLYQVGLVLHEMVHGPFQTDDLSFLDREARRQVTELGFDVFEDCDAFTKCRVLEAAMARAAKRRTLLTKSEARPYVSSRLTRVIRRATDPDHTRRYPHSTDFIAALQALSIPNWRPVDSEGFEAMDWRGWDWKIELVQRRKKALPPVSILRRASSGFRHWASAVDLGQAFA